MKRREKRVGRACLPAHSLADSLGLTLALTVSFCFTSAQAAPDSEARSKPVPHMPDGHPDLNGTWDNGSGIDFIQPQKATNGSVCISGCGPATPAPAAATARPAAAPPNVPKYLPQFQAKVADLAKRQVATDPVLRCKSPGLPRIGPPDKIVQTAGQMVFLYDDVSGAFFRIVPTDGRPHRSDVDDSYLGDSVGHWEGDTLVVEANQFNDDSWLTDNGAFHSGDLQVTERLHRIGDVIEYQAIAADPKVLAEPWKPNMRILKLTNVELTEPTPCIDKDLKHLVDDTHHPNPR
jgi:hypothetical protein